MKLVAIIISLLLSSGCAYRWGNRDRTLPGGYQEVAVPIFKNQTSYVSIESHFTNALIRELSRSKVAHLVPKSNAPVFIEGVIESVQIRSDNKIDARDENVSPNNALPANTVLAPEYRVLVVVQMRLMRTLDQKVIWTAQFSNERVYSAPQVKLAGVNTVNPLYNQSARMEVIGAMAIDMMIEAHDRMIENF